MVGEWDAQNILTRSISYDIWGVLIMDRVYWYDKTLSVGWKNPFFTWFCCLREWTWKASWGSIMVWWGFFHPIWTRGFGAHPTITVDLIKGYRGHLTTAIEHVREQSLVSHCGTTATSCSWGDSKWSCYGDTAHDPSGVISAIWLSAVVDTAIRYRASTISWLLCCGW